jgi:hypothetical protein
MSVRKIPKNHVHVTGRHAAQKSEADADFESMLEAEHLLLLDHDIGVKAYEVQPVNIPVPGVPRGYVPDAFVEFHPDSDGVIAAPEIREVKSTLDLEINEAKYKPKFESARLFCEKRGWSFKIITEHEIRTPRLSNVKFVRAYESQHHPQEMVDTVLCQMAALGQTDSDALLNSISTDLDDQLHWMPVLWHLVAKRRIAVDWDIAFGRVVPLGPLERHHG